MRTDMKKRTSAARLSSASDRKSPISDVGVGHTSAITMAETEDLSMLRRPLNTALKGFQEAKRAYENGTEEVRRLLLHECSLIYECNVCRNMFRSLANFISHKRIFCCASSTGGYSNSNGFSDRNSALIIHDDLASTAVAAANNAKRSRSTGASPVPRNDRSAVSGGIYGINSGLSNVIERLRREQVAAVVTAAADRIPSATTSTTTTVLQLERVPTTSQAVYQTIKHKEDDSMRIEVDEVHNLLSSHLQTVLGPDGKALTPPSNSSFEQDVNTLMDGNNVDAVTFGSDQLKDVEHPTTAAAATMQAGGHICDTCNLVFQTEKTLNLHIQKKHISTTYVFQCPTCSLTFMQPAAVIRHLANEHKKPVRRIRMMREAILKRRIQAGDVKVDRTSANKGTSRELKRLQGAGGALECDNIARSNEQQKLKSTCVYCAKSFERRAALSTHISNCRAKYEAQQVTTVTTEETEKPQNSSYSSNVVAAAAEMTSCRRPQIKISDSIKQESVTTAADDDEAATKALNELFANLDKQTFGSGLQTVKLEMFEADDVENETDEEMEEVQEEKEAAAVKRMNCDLKRISHFEDNEMSCEMSLADLKQQMCPSSTPLPAAPLQQPTPASSSSSTTAGIKTELNLTTATPTKKKQRRFRIVSANTSTVTTPATGDSPVSPSKHLPCRCKICNKQFNALSNLRRHISMFHYRARKFGCKLCDYRAFRRYDIVNHLGFVHKMQGEREAMSDEWVNVHEVSYSKDDVDGDIVLCTDEVATAAAADETAKEDNGNSSRKTYEKRSNRKKTTLLTDDVGGHDGTSNDAVERLKPKRRRQRLSQQTATANNTAGHKRPIRNRIKTVNKDFVYDLSNLLKTETDSGSAAGDGIGVGVETRPKRHNTMLNNSGATSALQNIFESNGDGSQQKILPLIPSHSTVALIRGAARRQALALVAQGRATSSTLPELPAERPQMRRLTATQTPHTDMSVDGGTVESRNLEATAVKRLKTNSCGVLFEDSFLEKIARRSGFRMKPLLQVDTALNSLLQKVNSANNNNVSDKTATATSTTKTTAYPNEVPKPAIPSAEIPTSPETNGKLHTPPPSSPCSTAFAAATPIDFISYQVAATASLEVAAMHQHQHQQQQQQPEHISITSRSPSQNGKHFFIEPEPSIPKSLSPPATPRKRITLMQRLAENKANKHRDSLLRTALEN